MSKAEIVIDIGSSKGEPGVSRRDGSVGAVVTLRNASDDGVRSWRWRLLDIPSGSATSLTNKVSAVTQFTPDDYGTYEVQLEVDEGGTGQVSQVLVAVLSDFDGASDRPVRIPSAGERDQANWRYDFGVIPDKNKRGWHPDFVELVLHAGGAMRKGGPRAKYGVPLTLTAGGITNVQKIGTLDTDGQNAMVEYWVAAVDALNTAAVYTATKRSTFYRSSGVVAEMNLSADTADSGTGPNTLAGDVVADFSIVGNDIFVAITNKGVAPFDSRIDCRWTFDVGGVS